MDETNRWIKMTWTENDMVQLHGIVDEFANESGGLVVITMKNLIHKAPTNEVRKFLLDELLDFYGDIRVENVREKMREEISDEFMAKAEKDEALRKKRSDAAKKSHSKKRRAARKAEGK